MPKDIDYYVSNDGSEPFKEWFEKLTLKLQMSVRIRLNRVAAGNLGKVNSVGAGVHELKFKDYGQPTLRIYFGNDSDSIIVLLLGGDKSSQSRDIKLAKDFWNDYKKNK